MLFLIIERSFVGNISFANNLYDTFGSGLSQETRTMKRFIVNSTVNQIQLNRLTCIVGTTNVFERTGIKDVYLKTCYCCSPELNAGVEKALIEFEAPSKEALELALQKIDFPFVSIVEVTKVEVGKN